MKYHRWYLLVGIAFIAATSSVAQWSHDPRIGTPVCVQPHVQDRQTLASDGAGGAYVVWEDYRSGVNLKIYAERLLRNGLLKWSSAGIPVCSGTGDQIIPQVLGDGAYGVIITWIDYRNGNSNPDIYAQRLNGIAHPLWATSGLTVCSATGAQLYPQIASDGEGG